MPSLTGLPVLDLAIGLALVYLLLSLLASAVQEWIAAIFALRSRTLEQGLESMLRDDGALPAGLSVPGPAPGMPARDLVDDLYAHPLIRALYRKGKVLSRPTGPPWSNGRLPSYISPRAFATALTDLLAAGGEAEHLGDRIGTMNIPDAVKYQLLTLLRQAGHDAASFRTALEAWFDDTMARVSGWYKRNTQIILFVIAVVVTVALNANSITIAQRLWVDPTVRAAVVQEATSSSVTGQTPGATPVERLNNAAGNVDSVAKLGLPLGWSANRSDPNYAGVTSVGNAIKIIFGWLLTIGAISLGAPFWFDSLGRLARLRSSGKPETPLPASSSGKPNERVVTQT